MATRALIYDSTCRFCTAGVERLQRLAGEIRLVPSQSAEAAVLLPEAGQADLAAQMHLVDGPAHYGGAEAVARTLMLNPWYRPFALCYYLPGLRQLCDYLYRVVARRRHCLGGQCDLSPRE